MTDRPQEADFGLTDIGGFTGLFVGIGQWLCRPGSGRAAFQWCHSVTVVMHLGELYVIQAMPLGIEMIPLDEWLESVKHPIVWSKHPLTEDQRRARSIVARKLWYEGIKYNWFNYPAIALARLGFKPQWLRDWIVNNKRMICSQLTDEIELRAKSHLFNDNRLPQEVIPIDLFSVLNGPQGDAL